MRITCPVWGGKIILIMFTDKNRAFVALFFLFVILIFVFNVC